jgi:glycosyltransferase
MEQCFSSVSTQTYQPIEHIVVDGGSTDGTREWLEAEGGRFARWVSEPDRGVYDALNKGLKLATGNVIGFLHTDDFFAAADVVARIASQFADPCVDAVYGDLEYVSAVDPTRVIRRWTAGAFTSRSLATGWMPPHPTLFVRASVYQDIGGFDLRYRIAADYESVLRLFSRPGFQARYLPEVITRMRVGGLSNGSLTNILRKSREDFHALRTHRVGGFGTLFMKNARKIPQFF